MKTILIQFILLAVFSVGAMAQEKSRKEEKGDKFIFRYAYDKAIKSYTKADELTQDGRRNLAKCYHKTGQEAQAAAMYEEIVNPKHKANNEDYYNYVMVLKSTGNYADSKIWMDKFQQNAPNDLRAQSYVAHQAELVDMLSPNSDIKIVHLDFNSEAQEFGPSYYQNDLIYSSSQIHSGFVKRKNNANDKPYLEIYSSKIEEGQLNSPEQFHKKFNEKYHDGPASFSNEETLMAYTTNNDHDRTKDKIIELQIRFSQNIDGKWTKGEDFVFNSPEYSVGHPCLTEDGNTMYFVSDMPGGYGKADIYKTTKSAQGEWTTPMNLGDQINTESDELFPFFEEKNEILVFSSNGHFGLGGLDIFMVPMIGSSFGSVTNPGAPANSRHDDFSMILEEDMKKGYFASNRNGLDDDIYSINFTKGLNLGKRIDGIAMDNLGAPIPGTFVTLFDEEGNVVNTTTTEDDGFYSFFANNNKKYTLLGTKSNLQDGNNTANTYGESYIVEANLTLLKAPLDEDEVIIVNNEIIVVKKIFILDPIYFDFNRSKIRPDAIIGLDKIIKTMNDNPEMVVKISAYTDCRATEEYNQVLSNQRAQATIEYIRKKITNPERISGIGYGETDMTNDCIAEGPVVSDCTEQQHQANRRTEFVVISNK